MAMSESELQFGQGEEFVNPLAAQLRALAAAQPDSVVGKVILGEQQEKEAISVNPRKYIDDIASIWKGVRIEKVKKEIEMDKVRYWVGILDSALLENDRRNDLIDRLFQKAGFLSDKENRALRNHAMRIFSLPNHPVREFLEGLPGEWRLGFMAYSALDFFLDLYNYDLSRVAGLGPLLIDADKQPGVKDSAGHLHVNAFAEVVHKWYSGRST